MSTLPGFILAFCLLVAAGAQADDVQEFKAIEKEIFGEAFTSQHSTYVEKLILKMIGLIEKGTIPFEVQGSHDLKYLKSLINDCSVGNECQLKDYTTKLARLSKPGSRRSPNLNSYRQVCRKKILDLCMKSIVEQIQSSLHLDQSTKDAIHALTYETYKTFQPQRSGSSTFVVRAGTEFEFDFHTIVLRALKRLDPEGSKKMAKKWTGKEKSLREFMDRIRSSCDIVLKQIDPMVKLFPAQYSKIDVSEPFFLLPGLHYTLKTCTKVTQDWSSIVKSSLEDYEEYLIEPKQKSYYSNYESSGGKAGGGSMMSWGLLAGGSGR